MHNKILCIQADLKWVVYKLLDAHKMATKIILVATTLLSAWAMGDSSVGDENALPLADIDIEQDVAFEVEPVDRSHLMSHYLDPNGDHPEDPKDHELYHKVPKAVRELIDKHGYDVPKDVLRKAKHKKFKPTRIKHKRRKRN